MISVAILWFSIDILQISIDFHSDQFGGPDPTYFGEPKAHRLIKKVNLADKREYGRFFKKYLVYLTGLMGGNFWNDFENSFVAKSCKLLRRILGSFKALKLFNLTF